MLDPSQLHVFTARSNPLHWTAPHRNWLRFAQSMVDAGITLTVVECAYGEEDFHCTQEFVRHIGVRAKTRVWNKENLLNIGIRRTPEAKYIAWFDADILFRRPDWPMATLRALQHYDVVQPWSDAYDLGPNEEHMAHHRAFCRQYFYRQPMIATAHPYWHGDGGPHIYPHSGYAWAMTRDAYDAVGGLFELGGMGSGDHHLALALIGEADRSIPGGISDTYRREVKRWENRAQRHIGRNIGFVEGTIEHLYHGRKSERGYRSRWGMFIEHAFDPLDDLRLNSHGVLEFDTHKPELRHDFDLYLQSRNEDINAV